LPSANDGDPASSTDSAAGGLNTSSGNGNGKGFLENKGAMTGTFAVVGLVGVALIGGFIYFLVQRRRRFQDDDEINIYLDKPSGGHHSRGGHGSLDLAFPSDHNAYPIREVNYGATQVNYNDPGSYGMDYPPDTSSVADARPASAALGTAYAAAISQQVPYQYNGHSVHGHNDAPTATGSSFHPFADPVSHAGPQDHHEVHADDPFNARQ